MFPLFQKPVAKQAELCGLTFQLQLKHVEHRLRDDPLLAFVDVRHRVRLPCTVKGVPLLGGKNPVGGEKILDSRGSEIGVFRWRYQ